jgi:hypothetical protein
VFLSNQGGERLKVVIEQLRSPQRGPMKNGAGANYPAHGRLEMFVESVNVPSHIRRQTAGWVPAA